MLDESGDAVLASASEAPATVREVITTGGVDMASDDPINAAQEIASLVERAGGRVESRNEQRATDSQPASAGLTLRIPSTEVNTTIDTFTQFGKVEHVDINREDVTATGRDLDARISALETSTARLTQLMSESGNVSDLLRVENELQSRQADLDSLRAQRRDLTDQVSLSTINVWIRSSDSAAPRPQGSATFVDGLRGGWNSLAAVARGLLVALGAALPWLVVAAVIVAAVRVIIARRRRLAVMPDDATAGSPDSAVDATDTSSDDGTDD
jgi:hypothetical protein